MDLSSTWHRRGHLGARRATFGTAQAGEAASGHTVQQQADHGDRPPANAPSTTRNRVRGGDGDNPDLSALRVEVRALGSL